MLIVNARETSLRIEKKFRVSFSPEDCLPFPSQGTFFPQNMLPANVSISKVTFDLFLYWKVSYRITYYVLRNTYYGESLRTFSIVIESCRNVNVRFD